MTVWYVARGAGLAALVLLTVTTCIGALTTGRGRAVNRVVVHYVHRVTASLGLAVLVLHVSTILADSYAHVGWRGALVPFASGYRPTWVGLGTLAGYTFVLVAAVGAARGRFAASERGARSWRWLHGFAYLAWVLAMAHGFRSGTDVSLGWVRLVFLLCGAAVFGSVAMRIARPAPRLVATGAR